MFNLLSKLIFYWKKPKVVIVTGQGRTLSAEAIYQTLKQYFKVKKISESEKSDFLDILKNEILIFDSKDKEVKKFEFFLNKSQKGTLVVTHGSDIPPEIEVFGSEREEVKGALGLAKKIPAQTNLILNFDDETIREIADVTNLNTLTFGFQEGADLKATDIKLNSGTNFKINYRGNIVPIWLGKLFGKEQIYSALTGICVGTIFGLNLVEISEGLKKYQGLAGKMRLIKGIKGSWILDDSQGASVNTMIEALDILKKLEGFKRKIAVLGDIVGVGKYTIEAHETIGEKAAKAASLLFTFGPRARFIAKEAQIQGLALERIFQFDKIEEGKISLQDKIREGDLILVDGSKEMEMGKIVREIEAI